MTSTATPVLLSPFRLGPLQLRNRVVMAAHSTHFADRLESEQLAAYYVERARGGVGLIVHEPVVVHPSSLSRTGKIWGYDEGNAEAYRRTTDAVHEHGAAIVCQLIHNGRQVDGHTSGMPAWYPTEVARPGTSEVTHRMSVADIAEVVAGFAASARIAEAGGFDGVEIHAAHGYLLQAFLSPATNTRTDDYGGSTANRVRIVRDVLASVRAAVSSGFVVGVRLSGDEFQPGGLDVEGSRAVARLLAAHADYLSVVSGSLASPDRIVPDMSHPRGLNSRHAAALREVVGTTPLLVTGRFAEPADAEAVLTAGQADLVGLARALIADPEWVRKAADDAAAAIRPCVYANDCRDSISGRRSLGCMVNPDVGRELDAPFPVTERRRVVVVGGGVAGMESALAASAQGDDVVLFEQADRLGGQLLLAGAAPSRAELLRLERSLVARVSAAPVTVRLGDNATAEAIRACTPDLVVLATGAVPRQSRFPGAIRTPEVLRGDRLPTGPVVVFDESGGNGWQLFAAVELLAEGGAEVRVVLESAGFGTSVEGGSIPPLLRRLRARQVEIHLMSTVVGTEPAGVRIRRNDTGAEHLVADAALVVEPGRSAVTRLRDELADLRCPVVVVGDAQAPRRIATAIREGRAAVG